MSGNYYQEVSIYDDKGRYVATDGVRTASGETPADALRSYADQLEEDTHD